ncbi:MAG TPA: sulfurtransferase TusA family protein [bacterium]
MDAFTQGLRVDATLDVRGQDPSSSYVKARTQLDGMSEGQVLELHLDEGEVLRRLPFGLRAEGHEILVSEPATEGIRLLVRKRAPAS